MVCSATCTSKRHKICKQRRFSGLRFCILQRAAPGTPRPRSRLLRSLGLSLAWVGTVCGPDHLVPSVEKGQWLDLPPHALMGHSSTTTLAAKCRALRARQDPMRFVAALRGVIGTEPFHGEASNTNRLDARVVLAALQRHIEVFTSTAPWACVPIPFAPVATPSGSASALP